VLLRGEAGVGKTTVIARFIAGLGQRAPVLRGWCDALATPRPLGPLIDMLADLSGEQAAGVRVAIDAGDPEAIYARLVGMFGDGNAWVCVIEDLHWADGATLDLLRFLARRVESLPVLLVVSHRDDEIGAQHPVAVLLGDLATTAAVTRIALNPLSGDAVAVLAAGSGVSADASRPSACCIARACICPYDTKAAIPASRRTAARHGHDRPGGGARSPPPREPACRRLRPGQPSAQTGPAPPWCRWRLRPVGRRSDPAPAPRRDKSAGSSGTPGSTSMPDR